MSITQVPAVLPTTVLLHGGTQGVALSRVQFILVIPRVLFKSCYLLSCFSSFFCSFVTNVKFY